MDLKKPITLRRRIKNVVVDVLLSSTSHGLPNILKATKISIKIIWAIFTILSTGVCAYLIAESIYEVTTKTRVISEFNPLFPTITICNSNYFTSEFSVGFIDKLKNNSILTNPLMGQFELLAKIQANQPELENNKKNFGDSLNKLIVNCQFVYQPCNLSQFNFFLHTNYGNCYQYNSAFDLEGKEIELSTSMFADRLYGLKLILNVSVPDSLKFMNPNSGALIFVHNHTTYPLMVDPIAVSPKTETNIALARTFYESQPKPYSKCDENTNDINSYDHEYYKIVHKNAKGYSQALCVYQCFQKLFIDKCNCFVANFPCFYESEPCSLLTSQDCVNQVFQMLQNGDYIENECTNKCPLECEGMKFDKVTSLTRFSNSEFEKVLSEYSGPDSVYFNQSIDSYTSITENPSINVVGLFSSIGGVAGLFLGVSVLTFVEGIEILMQILFIFLWQFSCARLRSVREPKKTKKLRTEMTQVENKIEIQDSYAGITKSHLINHLGNLLPIDEIDASQYNHEYFMNNYLSKSKPLIFDCGEAFKNWSLEYLNEKCGQNRVFVRRNTMHESYKMGKAYNVQEIKFETYVNDLLMDNFNISDELKMPQFVEKLHAGPFLWIARSGHYEYTHMDPDDNMLTVVRGRKLVRLYGSNVYNMYPNELGSKGRTIQSQINCDQIQNNLNADILTRFKNTDCLYCLLKEGDMLYFPAFCWHQVKSPELTISVNVFFGDAGENVYMSKILKSDQKEAFMYWIFNIIKQNMPFPSFNRILANLKESLRGFLFKQWHESLDEQQIDEIYKESVNQLSSLGLEFKSRHPPVLRIRVSLINELKFKKDKSEQHKFFTVPDKKVQVKQVSLTFKKSVKKKRAVKDTVNNVAGGRLAVQFGSQNFGLPC
ncbi:amiloride-sensitive sodium channel subunit beta [Brachionus plicatilis]|uniref:Amiloride-sensitive sodium channel subunit beta n=1 Tax=Brachionus plicatilis TaxID=10195 RepID=A0A3M7SFV4_BRAPC|nr:amiloride-sensitive sodium channel subunit beta [Brachionus plicatilis]